jgi:hypothetical protein
VRLLSALTSNSLTLLALLRNPLATVLHLAFLFRRGVRAAQVGEETVAQLLVVVGAVARILKDGFLFQHLVQLRR